LTKIARILLSWALPIIAGLLFVVVGATKFIDPTWRANFARWGYPAYSYAVTGIVEIVGGASLFFPRVRLRAAIGLAAVMIAAILTATLHGEPRFARTAIIYLLMVLAIALWERSRTSKA